METRTSTARGGLARTIFCLFLSLVLAFGLLPADSLAWADDADAGAEDGQAAAAVAAADDASDGGEASGDAAAGDEEAVYTVTAASTGGSGSEDGTEADAGTVTLSLEGADGAESSTSLQASAGDTVTIEAEPAEGYYLAQVRWGVPVEEDATEDEDASEDEDATEGEDASDSDATATPTYAYTVLEASDDGSYSFTMPEGDVQVMADFVSIVWDGTIDLSWYVEGQTSFTLSYAAQYEGLAAIVNGIFTTYPTTTVGEGEDAHEVPDYEQFKEGMGVVEDEDGETLSSECYGEFSASYRLSDSQDDYGRTELISATTRVIGDPDCLVANCSAGELDQSSQNEVTTTDYWYGDFDFEGVTISIDADLDFGGVQESDGSWDVASPLFMPVAGQYAMLPGDDETNGYSKLSASFNGVLDGQGHSFQNVYCERYANSAYGDSVSIGLVGRLGNHDGDDEELAAQDPTVRNIVLESGLMSGRRSVGGIVGKIGQTTASLGLDDSTGGIVEYCINKADVVSTDAKGSGGIVGASWNAGLIHDCANFGSVSGSFKTNPVGGIAGSNEVPIYNCYSVGEITAQQESFAMGIGTNNGGSGDEVDNCYWLEGSASGGGYYGSITGTVSEFSAGDLEAEDLNGTSGTAWYDEGAAEGEGENAYGGRNYPLLYYQYLGADEDAVFTVSVEQPEEGGTISATPTSGSYGTTIRLSNEAEAGWVLDHYLLSGSVLEGSTFTLDGNRTVSGVFRAVEEVDFGIEDTSDADYEISVTKTGVALVDGEFVYVEDWPVESGDAVYEGDVLSYTASIKEGAAPEDEDYEYNGVFNFRTSLADGSSSSGASYTVTGQEESLEVAVSFVGSEQKSWSSLADSSFFDAEDVQDSYTITTAEQLAGLAELVAAGESFAGVSIVLGCDISLENPDGTTGTRLWTPIGDEDAPFEGDFDGAGFTISGMALDALGSCEGLFGATSGASIRDVTVEGSLVLGASSGAIVGLAANTSIEGCTNTADISSSDRGIGGVVGVVEDEAGAAATSIVDCENAGSVSGRSEVGGIVGEAQGASADAPVQISGCTNTGELCFEESGSISGGAGGIAGAAADAALWRCANEGAVSGGGYGAEAGVHVGGLVGYAGSGSLAIDESLNRGEVEGGAASAGGLVGCSAYGELSVADCYSTGAVSNEEGLAGGLVGYVNNSGSTTASLSDSYAAGAVTGGTAGAIAGRVRGLAVFENLHYLAGICSNIVGLSTGASSASSLLASAAASEEMAVLASALGTTEIWHDDALGLNGGCPQLAWETPCGLIYRGGTGELLLEVWLPEGWSLEAGDIEALYGEEPEDSLAGYESVFLGWMSEEGGEEQAVVEAASAGEIEVWASFLRTPVVYTISYELDGGVNAAENPSSYTVESEEIVFADATREGYDFAGWVDAEGNAVESIPAGSTGDLVLTATWSAAGEDEEERVYQFTDVQDPELYYFYAVYALADAGIINGVSDTLYGVNQNMTRAQFATIVWRIAGEPSTSYDAGYTDVKDGQYYTEAINWAAEEGVVTGYTNGKYGINDTLSFEDMCLIIARYANGGNAALQAAVTDSEAASILAAFADGDAVAAYADKGMAWCVTEGLVTGNTDGTIVPQESVTRQRAAVVVARWQDLVD